MASINYRLLRLEIQKQATKGLAKKIEPLIKAEFKARKETFLLDEFDSHPVTRELEAGPELESSAYVQNGNLFSLLGFNAGEEPAAELRDALDKSVKLLPGMDVKVSGDKLVFSKKIEYPTIDEVSDLSAKVAPLEWTTRGFVGLIERGITGLPWYFFSTGVAFTRRISRYSRSGTAIQKDDKQRTGTLGPIRYISDILAKFKNSLKP